MICPDRLDIATEAVDTSDLAKLRAAVEKIDRLDALYVETPSNPTLSITDIEAAGELVRSKFPACLVVVDNTFLGPVFQSPFLHGADVVLYSATKFIGGQSDLLCGLALTKSEDLMNRINSYRTILGPTISADTAWLVTRSVETLWLRMERQSQKAEKVAAALAAHPSVERMYLPGHYGSEASTAVRERKLALYARQCRGCGSMISLIVRPNTRGAAYEVLNRVELAHLAVSLGGTETLIEHPRSMTHSDMSAEDLDACGIVEGMIRISIGLESSGDLIKDLLSALDAISTMEGTIEVSEDES